MTTPFFLGVTSCLPPWLIHVFSRIRRLPSARFSELWQLHGIVVGLRMRIACLVADCFNHRVMRWSPGATCGELVAGGHDFGDCLDQLSHPCCIAVGPDGSLCVSDTYNHRVLRWAMGDCCGTIVAGGRDAGSGLE